jgi:hypothetical protein
MISKLTFILPSSDLAQDGQRSNAGEVANDIMLLLSQAGLQGIENIANSKVINEQRRNRGGSTDFLNQLFGNKEPSRFPHRPASFFSRSKIGVPNPVMGSHPLTALHPALGMTGDGRPATLSPPHPTDRPSVILVADQYNNAADIQGRGTLTP